MVGASACNAKRRWRQNYGVLLQRQKSLTGLLARDEVAERGDEAITRSLGEQKFVVWPANQDMRQPAAPQLDKRCQRRAKATPVGQYGNGHGECTSFGRQHDERINRSAFENASRSIAILVSDGREIERMPLANARPTLGRDDQGHRLVGDGSDFTARRSDGSLDVRTACIAVPGGIGANFLDDEFAHQGIAGQQFFQVVFGTAQFFKLLLDSDAFQTRQLTQTNLEDIVGLPLGKRKTLDQRGFRFVRLADDVDHLIDMQKDDVPPFEDMDTFTRFGQAEFTAPPHGNKAETTPFAQQIDEAFLARAPVEPDGDEVDRRGRFQTGMRQQQRKKFFPLLARANRLEDETNGIVLARFVTRTVEL